MSNSPADGQPQWDQPQWEYRHLFLIPQRADGGQAGFRHGAPGSVENLVENIEDLEKAREQGWRLLSVKIEEDDNGRCWLNAYLKRRKATGRTLQGPLPRPGIEKAA